MQTAIEILTQACDVVGWDAPTEITDETPVLLCEECYSELTDAAKAKYDEDIYGGCVEAVAAATNLDLDACIEALRQADAAIDQARLDDDTDDE